MGIGELFEFEKTGRIDQDPAGSRRSELNNSLSLKTHYKFIHFDDYTPEDQKTKRFMCFNSRHLAFLGEVKWNGGWRQYCFFPASDCVFSKGCMEDINHFIQQLMDERKNNKKFTSQGRLECGGKYGKEENMGGMRNTGEIKRTDWKLYVCIQEVGVDRLVSWGPCDEAREALHNYAEHGHDAWLIAPDGTKEVVP